jgi:hypothetical protein
MPEVRPMNAKLAQVLSIALILVISGCADLYQTVDQKSASDGERTLELSVSPDAIDIAGGGSVTVLVQITFTNGRPVANGIVSLSSTLGTLGALSLTTDQDGIAATTLTPGEITGWAVVVATHKTIQTSVAVSFYETGDDANP